MRDKRPRIIDVVRKPRKCPVCGERVVDIGLGHRGAPTLSYLPLLASRSSTSEATESSG